MKRLIFSEDIFHTLAQMEDKDAGQMAKAIACYAHDGTQPKWSNTILMALFSLFKKQIDIQTDLEERRRIVNKENAKGRNKQKPKTEKTTLPISKTAKESESAIIPCKECEPQPIAAGYIPFERIAAIYPKVDSSEFFRKESRELWESLGEEERQEAIGYASDLKNNPDETAEIGYLRQFLTARPWERKFCTPD